jgi:hypothetical protein
MKQFYTPYERITKDNRPPITHKNMPVDRPDKKEDLQSARFESRFWTKMIEVSKVERVVSTYILDDNIYYEAV